MLGAPISGGKLALIGSGFGQVSPTGRSRGPSLSTLSTESRASRTAVRAQVLPAFGSARRAVMLRVASRRAFTAFIRLIGAASLLSCSVSQADELGQGFIERGPSVLVATCGQHPSASASLSLSTAAIV